MKKKYPNLPFNQLASFIVLAKLVQGIFKRIVLFMLIFLCSATFVSAQCNSDIPLPFINGSNFTNLTATGDITGGCTFLTCSASNESRLIDSDLNNFATAVVGLGVGGFANYRVTDPNIDYPAGTYAGYRIDTGGILNVNLLGGITIKTYLNGTLRESNTAANLLSLGLLEFTGNNYVVGFNTTKSFDAIEISVGGVVSLLNSVNVYYPVVRKYCQGPALSCNVATAMNLPTYPVYIDDAHTGINAVACVDCSIENVENAISSNVNDYAQINLTAGIAAMGNIAVKDQFTDYPAGTYAGFEIENANLLSLSALGNVTITTYLNGALQEGFSGNNLVANSTLLSSSGRNKVGFVSTKPFDEVQISINQTVGLTLGATKVYNAVFEAFCAGPALACNTQTPISAPTYPVYINGANTGIDGVGCVSCNVKNAENLIDNDASTYAEIDLSTGILASGSISVKDQITDYSSGSFVGFTIEKPALVNVNALDAITITTYLDGALQEIKSGNTALATVGTNLLVGTSPMTFGFVSTKAFDEVRITVTNTVSVNLGIVKVYQAIFEKLCPVTLQCNTTYSLTNPTFPVIIDSNRTGVDGVACVACAVDDTNNVLTASTTDYARIRVTAGVIAPTSIAVWDQLSTYPTGTFAGFTIRDRYSLVQLDLFSGLTISTYLDGVFQESRSGGNLLNLSLLTPFGSGTGIYNVGFRAIKSFDEIRITVGAVASVINDIDVFGAFVNTSGTSGGTLFCAVIDAVDDNFLPIAGSTGNPNIGNVLTNDTLSGTPVAINDVDLTVTSPATPLSVGAPVPSIDPTTGIVSVPVNTPAGTYSITYQICYKLNALTCDTATVTVIVSAAAIVAADDSYPATVGATASSNIGNVLSNDTLNGTPVAIGNVNFTVPTPATPVSVGAPVPSIDTATGVVSIPAGTPAGTYTITYQICEKLNPTNCDTATVTVIVSAAAIVATDDNYPATVGATGNSNVGNVLINDTLNGVGPVAIGDVNFTVPTPAIPVSAGAPVPSIDSTTGVLSIPAGTPAGNYTITYQICEKLNPSNCDTATVTIAVSAAVIIATDDNYQATIGAMGSTNVGNVLTNDTLNGTPVAISNVNFTVPTPATPVSVGAPVPSIDTTTGVVSISAGTPAGTYTMTYQICEKLNPSNCDTATVTVIVKVTPIDAVADNGTINGVTGGDVGINVFDNDKLNGVAVNPSDVNFNSTPNGPLTVNPDGTVTVLPNTSPGTYTVDYTICEKLNPTNCDTATVMVEVTSTTAIINAVDDNGTINGLVGGDVGINVYSNDKLNGGVVNQSNVNLTSTIPPNNPLKVNADGTVTVLPNTPAGTYTIDYTIYDASDSNNFDSATVTVTVMAAAIVATDDNYPATVGATGNSNVDNVLTNDTLNGVGPVAIGDVNFTVPTPAIPVSAGAPVPSIDPTTGVLSIPAGTPAGTYTITYQICEKLNPTNCDTATVTVPVSAAAIVATDDNYPATVGATGNSNVDNVLTNDTLNGVGPVAIGDVNFTVPTPAIPVSAGAPVPSIDPTTGVLSIPAGTPAGNYTITYQICEKLNSSNCDTATVTIAVSAAAIIATDDNYPATVGATGSTNVGNVLTNDTLNGNPVAIGDVNFTVPTPAIPVSAGAPVPSIDSTTGVLSIPAGTPAGNYTITYQICEKLNSSNCDTASVTVAVSAAAIIATDDNYPATVGATGSTNVGNVLTNDTLNGNPVAIGDVNFTVPTPAIPVSAGAPIPSIETATGVVSIPAGTPAGTYTITYQICEKLNPTNCDSATVTVTVSAVAIDAIADTNTSPVYGNIGGNTGINVFTNDTLGGNPLNPSDVNFSSTPNGPLTVNTDGSVTVAPNTPAGTYTVSYTICEKLNPTNCDSATVTVTVSAVAIDAIADTNTSPVYGNTGGNTGINVFANDTLGGNPLNPSDVNFSSTPNGPLTVNTDGSVTVAPNTPAGTYTVSYTICEKLNPTNCDTAAVTVVVSFSSIAVVKTGTVGGTVKVGDLVTYTFTVTNTGNTTLSNVVVNDALTNSMNLTVTPSTLAPNAVGVATVTYAIKQSDIDAGKVTNSAIVTGTTPAGGTVTDTSGTTITNDTPTVTTITSSPSIAVVKTGVVSGTVKAGNLITYTFTVTNTGNTTLNNVVINDPLTNTVNQLVSPSTLAPNAVGVVTVTYVIKQSDIDAGKVTNSATVTGTTPTGGTVTDTSGTAINNDSPTITSLNQNSSISILKEGTYEDKNKDGIANVGDVVNYSFTVTNTGNVSLSNITIQDNNVPVVKGTLNSLAGGASDSLTFTAVYSITDADIASGYVYNSALISAITSTNATVTAVSNDPTPCAQCPILSSCLTCTITAIPQSPSIAIVKKGIFKDENEDGYAEIGETIDYSFTVMNTGNLPLTNVTLTDALPGIVISGGPINLAVGATDGTSFKGTYHITQQDIVKGSVTNQAMIKGITPTGAEVTDMSDDDSPLQDDPTVLGIDGCSLEVFNAVSPDGDGLNDIFRIRGIECYPKNTVQVFNRWGVKVYEADGYNNDTVAFKGVSEGRVTVNKSEGLPSGTYFYVIKYEDFSGTGIDKSGYLNISRD